MDRKRSIVALVLICGVAALLAQGGTAAAAEPCALCGGACPSDSAVTLTDWQTNEKREYDCLSCAIGVMAKSMPWSRVAAKSPVTGEAIKLTRTQSRWTAGPAAAVVVAPAGAAGECIPYQAFASVDEFKKWVKKNARAAPPSAEPILLSELPARYAARTASVAAQAPSKSSVPTLHDVPDTHWAHGAVVGSIAGGLLTGYPDGSFRGEESLTRYEMAMIAQRVLAKLGDSAVMIASADAGTGNGNGGSPQPTPAAREMVKELADELHAAGADQGEVRAALNLLTDAVAEGTVVAIGSAQTAEFLDVPPQHWASAAVKAVAAQGLMDGYPDGTFRGNQPLRRYEIAVVLQRLLTKMASAPPVGGGPAIAEGGPQQGTPQSTAGAGATPSAEGALATEESLEAAEQRLAQLRTELADAGLSRAQIDTALGAAEDAVAAKRREREASARSERVGMLVGDLESSMRAAGISDDAVAGAVHSASTALEQEPQAKIARPASKRGSRDEPAQKKPDALPNFFGQGGGILTPSAHIIDQGTGYVGIGRVADKNLYFSTYGLQDKLEVTATATGGDLPSRLIFSGKYLMNRSTEHNWTASLGILDALDEIDTTIYGVWTKDTHTRAFSDESRRLSLSAGVGAGSLLDGLFGGAELEVRDDLWVTCEFVDFGGDDDVNVGVVYRPKPWWHVRGVIADDDVGAQVFWGQEF